MVQSLAVAEPIEEHWNPVRNVDSDDFHGDTDSEEDFGDSDDDMGGNDYFIGGYSRRRRDFLLTRRGDLERGN